MAETALEVSRQKADLGGMQVFGLDAPLAAFVLVAATFALFAGLEIAAPFRAPGQPRGRRWMTNLALFAIDTLAVRMLAPVLLVGMAVLAETRGWGLFNTLGWPFWLEATLAILALDLALFLQHWATHRVPLLWRLHRVHHTDRDFDVTTAARFHPVEIVLSMGYKLAVVAALGAPALAVFVFEAGFTMLTIFNHSNTRLPARIEPAVRALIVTQDMHRVHHSVVERETNSNYGTILSGWDRLFGTYRAQPAAGAEKVRIGLSEFQDDKPSKLGWSLALPFLGDPRHK